MTKLCPTCNQTNPPDAAFCLNCSARLGPTIGGPGYQQQTPPFGGAQAPYVGAPPQYAGGQNFGMQGNAEGSAGQKAIVSLVLAIAGLVCCGPFTGIPAAIVGWMELSAINSGSSPVSGKWMALVGLWGGIAVSVIHGALMLLYLLLALASSPY